MLTDHFIDAGMERKRKKKTFCTHPEKQAPNQHNQIPVGFKYG